jgi:hypothetical protein
MDNQENDKPNAPPRRPYQPPKVEESASFEHLVLACGHVSPYTAGCGAKGTGGTTRS